jgi:protein involved in ribonucleotide reduction
MKYSIFTLFICAVMTTSAFAAIYVAPDGSDTNPGTMAEPFESIQKAQALMSAGDTVYIRGGQYKVRPDQISHIEQNLFACISYLNKNGSAGKTIKYWAYPGETPVFDFSDVKPANQRVVGIWVAGNYIHIKGLEMTGVQVTITSHTESYCIYSRGNYNIFEQISMHDNKGTGLRHYKGGHNLFLNCDAYRNHDDVSENKLGGNTDGFGCHPADGGTGNVFKGCRAWFNSDDGYDCIRSSESIVFDSCWAFYNGYSTSFASLGDGNGFKAGGYAYDAANLIPSPVPRNTIEFCVAVRNKANGFYSNHHLAGNFWYNNSAYQNSINYNMVNRESPTSDNINVNGYDHVLKNNLGYKARGPETAYIDPALCTLENNSFDLPITLSDDDFVSLDESLLTAPRKPDGSLPDIDFMRLAPGSHLIDAGVDIGFAFTGSAPDLGAFEFDGTASDVQHAENSLPEKTALYQNYPNPFNPETTISYLIPEPGHVTLTVFNLLSQKIRTLVDEPKNSGQFLVRWDSTDDSGNLVASGIYVYRMTFAGAMDSYSRQRKMQLLR